MLQVSCKSNVVTCGAMLTYTDAQYSLPPISGGLWNEQPVVERTRACIQLSFQAMIPACPCQSYTQCVALEGADAHYSWSHTARSSHACHRHHPRKTFPKERLLRQRKGVSQWMQIRIVVLVPRYSQKLSVENLNQLQKKRTTKKKKEIKII